MLTKIKKLAAVGLAAGLTHSAAAFSLLGPLDGAFQTAALGYVVAGDIGGGPMNLGEEYRWNVPTLTYAFDESFLNYFGTAGVTAVERAFTILNNLPNVDQVVNGGPGDANLYVNGEPVPTSTRLVNFQAQALGLLDLRSITLSALVEQLGLAQAERWVWCLRARQAAAAGTNYLVIKRNFDPVTWLPSSFVNGTLYTYSIVEDFAGAGTTDAREFPADPLASPSLSVSSRSGIGLGEFFFGLTRDDIGGLRYLYRTANYNRENLRAGTSTQTNSQPWHIIGITNVFPSPPVITALRPGIQRVTFSRAAVDSLLGTVTPYTNFYTDSYVTNSTLRQQNLQYIATAPDILFTADDLGFFVAGNQPFPFAVTGSTLASWQNNDALNGAANLAGPGVIGGLGVTTTPRIIISFNKVGPSFTVGPWPFFISEGTHFPNFVWGSWEGVDDTPVLFPNFLSIQDLEQQLLAR